MGGLIIVVGLGWLVYHLLKDACIKPVPPGTDYTQAIIDSSRGVSGKELDRRMTNGYYVKKEIKKCVLQPNDEKRT